MVFTPQGTRLLTLLPVTETSALDRFCAVLQCQALPICCCCCCLTCSPYPLCPARFIPTFELRMRFWCSVQQHL
jgi:hypothetical protein